MLTFPKMEIHASHGSALLLFGDGLRDYIG